MPLNSVLAYLGLLGVLIGGLGLAYEVAVPRNAANDAPPEVTASVPVMPNKSPTSERSAWPLEPRHAAVPFHEPMLELLTPPPVPAPPVQSATAPAEPDLTVGIGTRERGRDKKERKAKATPKPREADDDTAVEVEVRDQTGRRLRTERVPRERVERTARDEREPRQYERRGFEFPLFRLFGGDRW